MRNQRNACLTHGIISAPLERRDKDDIGVYAHNHLIIEVPLNPYFGCLPRFQTLFHLLVEQVAGTGDARHVVAGIQTDEVGQLQGSHADGMLHRSFYHGIAVGDTGRLSALRNQGIPESIPLFFLRVAYVHQAYISRQIFHRIAFGVDGNNCGSGVRNGDRNSRGTGIAGRLPGLRAAGSHRQCTRECNTHER